MSDAIKGTALRTVAANVANNHTSPADVRLVAARICDAIDENNEAAAWQLVWRLPARHTPPNESG